MGVLERRQGAVVLQSAAATGGGAAAAPFFFWGAGGAFVISKRIERTLPLLLAAQQRNRALLESVSVIYLCILLLDFCIGFSFSLSLSLSHEVILLSYHGIAYLQA